MYKKKIFGQDMNCGHNVKWEDVLEPGTASTCEESPSRCKTSPSSPLWRETTYKLHYYHDTLPDFYIVTRGGQKFEILLRTSCVSCGARVDVKVLIGPAGLHKKCTVNLCRDGESMLKWHRCNLRKAMVHIDYCRGLRVRDIYLRRQKCASCLA